MFERIVLITCFALNVLMICFLLYDLIILFQIVKVGFIKIWDFERLVFDLVVFPETEIISEEFSEDIVIHFFGVIDFLASFNCDSGEC